MPSWGDTFRSSIGSKIVMGATGAVLVLFVIGHMLGNLQIFLGQDALNHYGELLRTLPEALWAVRLGLLAAVVLHVVFALRLTAQNRAARPTRYAKTHAIQVGLAPRTLIWTGAVVAAFVVYHLLHFTFRTTHPEFQHMVDAHGRHDVYRMVIEGFRAPWISLFYAVANGLLAVHLSHGVSSAFQTLGLSNARWRPLFERTGPAIAWIVFLGNLSIPAAVMLGVLPAAASAPPPAHLGGS
jgi:succinate dehydrogenase / fumarate reductase cytochrome b subunit